MIKFASRPLKFLRKFGWAVCSNNKRKNLNILLKLNKWKKTNVDNLFFKKNIYIYRKQLFLLRNLVKKAPQRNSLAPSIGSVLTWHN